MKSSTITALVFFSIATLAACGPAGSSPAPTITQPADDESPSAELTAAAEATRQAAIRETEAAPPTASPTAEPTATENPTATPTPLLLSVSQATNCRSGPDSRFEFLGVLNVDEQTEVVAKSPTGDYWYIVNPDDPEGYCWLIGAYASIDGDTEALPVHTPAPTPTPAVGFDVWFHGYASCGDNLLAIFAIRNGGAVRLWSGWIGAYTVGTSEKLYGPILDRHPFSETATETCPPGHGNELFPGEVNYILVPLKSPPAETDAYVEFSLCSADHGGGECVTKVGYFYIP